MLKYYAIIPAYNEEAFMRITLESIAAQTVLPAKVVVVNDNSTDNTAAIVTEFAREHAWLSLVNKKIGHHTPSRK